MPFIITPILERMETLYLQPRDRARFETYLQLLQGNSKGEELILPIMGYNPMGKEHVLEKIRVLMDSETEFITHRVIQEMNDMYPLFPDEEIQVVINLADDIGGAWTQHNTTDFKSKFELNPLVNRQFCAPYFWTNETITETIIRNRTKEYLLRYIHWIQQGPPTTLMDYFKMEQFAFSHSYLENPIGFKEEEALLFLHTYEEATSYDIIFNFFYGDEASELMGQASYGMGTSAGILLAQHSDLS